METPTGGDTDVPSSLQDASIVRSTVKVGLASGAAGLVTGGAIGLFRSKTPVLFAIANSLQWLGIGSGYWACRSLYIESIGADKVTPSDRFNASATGGAVTGAVVAALTRGRGHVFSGGLIFAVLGSAGQTAYDFLDRRHTFRVENPKPKLPFLERISLYKYSPIKRLSDEELLDILKEKRVAVEAQLALVDEQLKALNESET